MRSRPLEAWETSAPAPFLTINPGGPLEAVVTISTVIDGKGCVLTEAAWTRDGTPQSTAATVDGFTVARVLAHEWADGLAVGLEPSRAPGELL